MARGAALSRLSTVTADQWGMVTAGQARRLGVSRVDVGRLVSDGVLAVVDGAARVYRLVGAPENPDLDPLRAAWLQLGGDRSWSQRAAAPDAVVRCRSAAHLWGVGDLIPRDHAFYTTCRSRLRRDDVEVRVRPALRGVSWTWHDGLPVTDLPQTVADLLIDSEDETALARLVGDALYRGLMDRSSLLGAVEPTVRRYGYRTAAELVAVLVGNAP